MYTLETTPLQEHVERRTSKAMMYKNTLNYLFFLYDAEKFSVIIRLPFVSLSPSLVTNEQTNDVSKEDIRN